MNPVTSGGEQAEARWKKLLTESVDSRPGFTPKAVRIVFYVIPSARTGYDLDNLTKPVLDALFKVKCKSPYFGALFDCDDSVVRELHVVRHQVNNIADAGIDFEAWT